jgi:hypothetical protein
VVEIARAESALDVSEATGAIKGVCEAHQGEEDYRPVLGRAAAVLLRGADEVAPRLAEVALGDGDIDGRMATTHGLMAAAASPQAAQVLQDYLAADDVADTPRLCLALALRGAGGPTESLQIPDPGADGAETRFAWLALRAMDNVPEAAAELEDVLRHGGARDRYLSAHYLSAARARSAVQIFSGLRDADAPYMLRGLCAASLIRRGHSAGLGWFEKVLGAVSGSVQANLLLCLCRGVQDTLDLMAECRDVNVGRFV